MSDNGYQCDRYYQNLTYLIDVNGWEGIPQSTIINSIGFPVLLLLFLMLRKFAWDFGRAALVAGRAAKRRERWASLFYGGVSAPIADPFEQDTDSHRAELRHERRAFSWLRTFWQLTDEQISARCGSDAVQYLLFERYLIAYSLCILILSMGVVFPLNYTADEKIDPSQFSRTTIMSVESSNPVLWIHVVFAFLYAAIAFGFMKRFSKEVMRLSTKAESAYESATRTLLIQNLKLQKANLTVTGDVNWRESSTEGANNEAVEAEEFDVESATSRLIQRYFTECYPRSRILDIQFAHDVARLNNLNQERELALESLVNAEATLVRAPSDDNAEDDILDQSRPVMHPFACSAFWCCCCAPCASCTRSCRCPASCVEVDAIEYYRKYVTQLTEKCNEERIRAQKSVVPIAFITFESHEQAAEVYADFRASCFSLRTQRLHSSVAGNLQVTGWDVGYAPTPDNLYWGNLATSVNVYRVRYAMVNAAVFLLTFFLTTPSIIINQYNKFSGTLSVHPLLVQFVPTIILWTSAVLLPVLVSYSETLIGHWTKTGEHHATMQKSFVFLLLMVLILPSVGLPSADALLNYLFSGSNYRLLMQCVFMASNGAFFVSYMIMSALLGNALELLRIADLIVYIARMCATRSSAEKTSVRKRVCFEFQFGVNYAWLLTMCAILITYSIPVPIITPCGVVYLIIKYYVDKYNLYYSYLPSRIDRKIHRSAINCFLVGALLLELNLVIYVLTRYSALEQPQQWPAVFSLFMLLFSMVIFFMHARGWLRAYRRFAVMSTRPAPVDSDVDDSRSTTARDTQRLNSNDSDDAPLLDSPIHAPATRATAHSAEQPQYRVEEFVFVPNFLRRNSDPRQSSTNRRTLNAQPPIHPDRESLMTVQSDDLPSTRAVELSTVYLSD